jgi:hypothetical protein
MFDALRELSGTDVKLWTALIAALASLVVAIIAHLSSRSNQRSLEQLRDKYAEARAERDAKRDYEYEARQRLYRECGPILFQLAEFSEAAFYRIIGLAETASRGDLKPGPDSFLRDDYYRFSTLYRLLAPSAALKLLQRRLTLVDLSLDTMIQLQYTLARQAFFAFGGEVDFARLGDHPLRYDPFNLKADSKAHKDPAVYWRQGLPLGVMDGAIEAILSTAEPRVITYAECEHAYNEENTPVHKTFDDIAFLVEDFHPLTRPVLWRILVAQACIYRVLSQPHLLSKPGWGVADLRLPHSDQHKFDWRSASDAGLEKAVVLEPLIVADKYFTGKLAPRLDRISAA